MRQAKRYPLALLLLLLLAALHTKAQLVPFRDSASAKYGYRDSAGTVIVPPQYDMGYAFSEGRAAVNKGATVKFMNAGGGKWGFIDSLGKEVIPLQYDYVTSFKNGRARGTKDKRDFALAPDGNILNETKVYYIYPLKKPVQWEKKQ